MGYDDGGDGVSGGVLCNARGYDDGGDGVSGDVLWVMMMVVMELVVTYCGL